MQRTTHSAWTFSQYQEYSLHLTSVSSPQDYHKWGNHQGEQDIYELLYEAGNIMNMMEITVLPPQGGSCHGRLPWPPSTHHRLWPTHNHVCSPYSTLTQVVILETQPHQPSVRSDLLMASYTQQSLASPSLQTALQWEWPGGRHYLHHGPWASSPHGCGRPRGWWQAHSHQHRQCYSCLCPPQEKERWQACPRPHQCSIPGSRGSWLSALYHLCPQEVKSANQDRWWPTHTERTSALAWNHCLDVNLLQWLIANCYVCEI